MLTAWLSAAQRERYAPSLRAPGSVEEFAERLADERRVVLEEGADPVADEVGAAAEAERAARRLPPRLLEGALLLGALVCVVLTVPRSLEAADLTWHLAAESGPLLGGMLAVPRARRGRRRGRDAPPGPGGRAGLGGLPSRSAGARVAAAQAAAGRVRGAGDPRVPGPGAPARRGSPRDRRRCRGAAALAHRAAEIVATEQAPAPLIGGVIALVAATAAVYFGGRRRERRARRGRAAEWFGPVSQAEEPPAR
ncbi:hypothetical protein [Brachybacterium sp. GPGPB12]|uniref:hypothetical protein n=1 Tax=Brachybacterium sp. GPGPB12 TaxID=3023517 RepID=UPI00313458BD